MQFFIWLHSNHLYGASVAVVKVHCPFDISCCLPVDLERLQGHFLQTYARTSIMLHVCWVQVSLECRKSLKEG
jgi:hypothetical protein